MMHFLDLLPVVKQHNCIEFMVDRLFFPPSILNITSQCFLPCQVSTEKFTDHLIEYPFFVICFSLTAFMILFIFNLQQFYYMCLSIHLSVFYMEDGGLLVFVHPCFSSNLGRFCPLFLQIISLPLSYSPFFLVLP